MRIFCVHELDKLGMGGRLVASSGSVFFELTSLWQKTRGSPKWGEAMPRKRKQARPSRVQKEKGTELSPLKRSLPVAWGRDIFYKVPRLADQFSNLAKPLEAGRKRLYGKQPDPLKNTRFQLPRPPE